MYCVLVLSKMSDFILGPACDAPGLLAFACGDLVIGRSTQQILVLLVPFDQDNAKLASQARALPLVDIQTNPSSTQII